MSQLGDHSPDWYPGARFAWAVSRYLGVAGNAQDKRALAERSNWEYPELFYARRKYRGFSSISPECLVGLPGKSRCCVRQDLR